jgi:hypothetical protein
MTEYGELRAIQRADDEQLLVTEFPHIPDWYEFERKQVRIQIEAGTYCLKTKVHVEALPNAKGYIPLGDALLIHDMQGFKLEGMFGKEGFLLAKTPLSMYSCHIEYEYFGKGDCIDLSTLEDTYYIYPKEQKFSVTKIALATEELFAYYSKEQEITPHILLEAVAQSPS